MKWEMNRVYYHDNMEILPSMEDKSIDLCLTDPPFNVDINKKGKENYTDDIGSVEYYQWTVKWFNEIDRICKRVVVTPGNQNEGMWEYLFGKPVGKIYHHKPNAMGRDKIAMFCTHEVILLYGDFKHRDFTHTVITANVGDERGFAHPCPKPLKLYVDILSQLKPKSVLDPFVGSGTSLEAAELLNIPWMGIEIDERYRPDIEGRLSRYGEKKYAEVI